MVEALLPSSGKLLFNLFRSPHRLDQLLGLPSQQNARSGNFPPKLSGRTRAGDRLLAGLAGTRQSQEKGSETGNLFTRGELILEKLSPGKIGGRKVLRKNGRSQDHCVPLFQNLGGNVYSVLTGQELQRFGPAAKVESRLADLGEIDH